VAKVERDRMLVEMDARYPQYGFATHKGYGTPEHVEALRAHGPCAEHRELFVRTILAGDPPPAESTDGEFSFE
jgi:ribonuclease HII